MRSGLFRLASSSALVITGLFALASIAPVHAQPKPAAGAKPAATAKPAAAKPAGTAKPVAAAGPKVDPKAKVDKTACATEANPKLPEFRKKDEAKKAYKNAETKFDKGEFEGAIVCYKLADAYIPGAAPKFKIAAALDKLGKVTEAVAAYDAFFASNPPEDKYKDKIAEAKTRTEALKQTPTKVTVAILPADAPNMKILLDGAPQASAELSVPPGKHTLTISADGYDTATQPIEVGFAETRDVSVTINKTPEPVVTATATAVAEVTQAPTVTAPPVQPPVEARSNVPAYVTLGLAGAGAIVGGIFGGMALASKSDFDKNPTVEKADETDRNALIADMSFAVALTFGVTGAVLLLTDSQPASAPAKTGSANPQKPVKKSGVRGFIAPYATPNGGGAAARFTF